MMWQPIETAPKDETPVITNVMLDGAYMPMKHISWTQDDGDYSMWVWSDDLLSDAMPDPEQPNFWFDIPPPPEST